MQTWKRFEYRIRDYFQKKGFTSERIPVSGVSSVIKGDVVAQKGELKFRIDAKSTLGKKEIRIRRGSLEKIKEEVKEGEIPLVVFSFYKHHTLYGIVERSLVPKWLGGVIKKSTWARDSIGLKPYFCHFFQPSISCYIYSSLNMFYRQFHHLHA